MVCTRSPHGMTLIEFLVALSIIIILALVSIPGFISLIKNHRLAANAENLFYAIQQARTEAVKQNANVYINFTTGDNWCYGLKVGSACNCTVAGNCTLGAYSAEQTGQIDLTTSGGLSGNSIYFEGSHAAANTSGAVTFTLHGGSTAVTLNIGRLGNVQMCSTGLSGYAAC